MQGICYAFILSKTVLSSPRDSEGLSQTSNRRPVIASTTPKNAPTQLTRKYSGADKTFGTGLCIPATTNPATAKPQNITCSTIPVATNLLVERRADDNNSIMSGIASSQRKSLCDRNCQARTPRRV